MIKICPLTRIIKNNFFLFIILIPSFQTPNWSSSRHNSWTRNRTVHKFVDGNITDGFFKCFHGLISQKTENIQELQRFDVIELPKKNSTWSRESLTFAKQNKYLQVWSGVNIITSRQRQIFNMFKSRKHFDWHLCKFWTIWQIQLSQIRTPFNQNIQIYGTKKFKICLQIRLLMLLTTIFKSLTTTS